MSNTKLPQSLNALTIRVGHLISITKSGVTYRFQNFLHNQDYEYLGNIYESAPINYQVPARSLDLENNSTQITLPNLPEIRELVEANDGFRDAIVQVTCIFPDNPNASPYAIDLMSVRSVRVAGADLVFELQSPFSSVDAFFPSIYYTTGTSAQGLSIIGFLPEVPIVSRVDLQ